MRWAAAFSSSPVATRLGFSRPSSSATIRTVVQSLMEPSHNDPLNHMPAHLSCHFGPPSNLAKKLQRSQATSPAACALLVNLASNVGAPVNLV